MVLIDNLMIHGFSDGFILTFGLFCAVVLVYSIQKLRSYSNVLPGPWGIPVFGYLPFLSKEPYKDLAKLTKKYGDVFSIQLGTRFVVILNTRPVMQKAFKGHAFDGRPQNGKEIELFDNGIIVADGEIWKKDRRFVLSAMRDFGFSTSRMEENIQREITFAAESLCATKGKPYNIRNVTQVIACNVIGYFIFGQRFSTETKGLKNALEIVADIVESVNFMAAYSSFPELFKKIPDELTGLKHLLNVKTEIYNFIDSIISEHENTFDENEIRDLIDLYLKNMHNTEDSEENKSLSIRQALRRTTLNMFIAGTHTTSYMLVWVFQVLAGHPEVQRQMQNEIDNVVGKERVPTLKDRSNLPYTEAVILETYRYTSFVPMTIYHRVTDDIMFEGYKIPKNSCALANIWNVHHSEDLWTEPEKFNPQRFLDKNGKIIQEKLENVIPFSIGKRNCVGEAIARMEIFLVAATMVQKFNFTLPNAEPFKFQAKTFIPTLISVNELVCANSRF